MSDQIEFEARLAALELVLATHILQSGVTTPGFDPQEFALGRRDAWTAIGSAMCQACTSDSEDQRFTQAYSEALQRMGHLLVMLAAPVQEAIDEVDEIRSASTQAE